MSAGMPATLAGAVLAHEYGHCLLAFDPRTLLRRLGRRPNTVEAEGFCEVLGAEWLRRSPSPDAAFHLRQMERSHDPIYGEGFRAMDARRAQLRSVAALLVAVTGDAPPVSRVKRSRRRS
jgi:hypothetical protein